MKKNPAGGQGDATSARLHHPTLKPNLPAPQTITPADFTREQRWLLWRLEGEKKIPYYADGTRRRGVLDSDEDRGRLVPFEIAQKAAQKFNGKGFHVGLAVSPPLVFVDLDDCYTDARDWCGTDEQRALLDAARDAGALIAFSQSGRGVHIFGRCSERLTRKAGKIEIYTGGRFAAWTGDVWAVGDGALPDLTEIARRFATAESSPLPAAGTGIPQGERNNALASLSGKLRRSGLSQGEIEAALLAANRERCTPPLRDVEVANIARSVARYAPGEAAPEPRALAPLLWLHEAEPVLNQRYVVEGVIAPGAAVLAFGDSNSGKTFFVANMGLHVAAGQLWRDRRVTRGLVVYVAAEGGHGIRNRLAAYRKNAPWTAGAPFAVLPQAVDLLDPCADTGPLIALVREAESECGDKAALIVLDTLARVTPGANENASEDMSAFIGNVDRLRAETGGAVLIIHHGGKDPTKGARGHSSLRAAVDTEILIEGKTGTRTATVTKQRDLPGGERWAFDLVPVELGTDEEGRVVQSCVVATTDAAPSVEPMAVRGANQQRAITALREWLRSHPDAEHIPSDELKGMLQGQNIGRQRRPEVIESLSRAGVLLPAVGGFTIIRKML